MPISPVCGNLPAASGSPARASRRRLSASCRRELGITAEAERYIASHQREVSGRLIHTVTLRWRRALAAFLPPTITAQLRWCTPQEALTLDLAPADIPLPNAFIAQRAADLPLLILCHWRHRFSYD